MDRSLGRLKAMVDSLIELHGENARVQFIHQISFRNKNRTRLANVSSYRVSVSSQLAPTVSFELDYPRGELVSEAEIAEEAKANG